MVFDPHAYGPAIAALLADAPCNELGPGRPIEAARPQLAAFASRGIATPSEVVDPLMARACLAGLWLRFDFLDESHRISQDLEMATGSYWHGIMHRREPDFANAKYWFRHVGRHPVYIPLNTDARRITLEDPAGLRPHNLVAQTEWDAFGMVDLCQQASQGNEPLSALCRRIQLREWELLFDYCFRQAIRR